RTREEARSRAAPFVPLVIAKVALFIAITVVWIVVGVATPLVLGILSLVFGAALRRAASACVRAAQRATTRMSDASAWLSGHRREAVGEQASVDAPRIRVLSELDEVRAVTEPQASAVRETARARREAEDKKRLDEELALEIEEEGERLVGRRIDPRPS